MTCREYEPLIALYVGGDLEGREVECHLAECPGCRELLEDLRTNQAALRELEPVDAAFLIAVRSGVLEQIEDRRPEWRWGFALAAALALAIAVLVAPRKPAPRTPPAPVAQAPAQTLAPVAEAPRPVKVAHRRKRAVKKATEPLVVKMLTDDPNIVIIWLVDQPGD